MRKVLLSAFLTLMVVQGAIAFSINIDPPSLWLSLSANESKTGTIVVENKGKDPINVKAYAQDWKYLPDRSKAFKTAGSLPYSCSNWISLYPSSFVVYPNIPKEVKYTITAPPGISGGHYSVIFFEAQESEQSNSKKSNIILAGRLGAIVYVDTAGAVKRSAKINKFSVSRYLAGKPLVFNISIENDGNTIIAPEGNIIITDKFEKLYARVDMKKFYIIQGEKININEKWAGTLPEGDYDVIATIDLGGDNVIAGQATINVK